MIIFYNRFSTAGLAHSAADEETKRTGEKYVMNFDPRYLKDPTPFTIIKEPVWTVIVGNIGTVFIGSNGFNAHATYSQCVGDSKKPHGRGSGEPVHLMKDGDIIKEYLPD